MFDDVKEHMEDAASDQEPEKKVEDIFSSTDQAEPATTDAPTPSNLPTGSSVDTMPAAYQPVLQSESGGQRKKVLLSLLGLVVLGIIGIGGYLAYDYFLVQPDTGSESTGTSSQTDQTGTEQPATVQTGPLQQNRVIDTDNDGLSDEEESNLGTDSTLPDSDRDGLFDREEVKIYQTDPLNPDTDNDGFLDGEEIKSGYDPLGPGRLQQLPESE